MVNMYMLRNDFCAQILIINFIKLLNLTNQRKIIDPNAEDKKSAENNIFFFFFFYVSYLIFIPINNSLLLLAKHA